MTGSAKTRSVQPTVTATVATALVVADMVGVGVFTSLGFQIKDITSNFAVVVLWTVGGIVALCGAICYAELATMFPRSSGEYNFLTRAFGPAVGFLAGWLSATVGFAAPVALAALAFGDYAKSIVPGVPTILCGLVAIWFTTAFHLSGVRQGGKLQIASTLLKLVLIGGFIVAGLITGGPTPVSFAPQLGDATVVFSQPFAISLVFVMYAYSGWNAATYIASEIKDPGRSLPRALFVGATVVLVLYVTLNAVFLLTTPRADMVGQINIAEIVGRQLFGAEGGRIAGALICLGLVSTVSAMMWIGPRVSMTMGEDVPLLRFFARRSDAGVPTVAILFQAVVASLLLFTQSFEAVLDFIQFSLTFCSFMTVLGLVKLRWTRPDLPRPYRAWGYPVTPLVFMGVTGFMMYYLVTTRPLQSFLGVLMMLSGLALYAIASLQRGEHRAPAE